MNPVFIIAEAGVNHNGRLDLAIKLVDTAKESGADAVKFQTFCAEKLVTRNAQKAKYQIENTGMNESQFEMLKRLELSREAQQKLREHCTKTEIKFISTPFDESSADILDSLGVEVFKIPSGEITNKELLQHIARKKKPILISTGMSYLSEVETAIHWIAKIWHGLNPLPSLIILHCVSNYPATPADINLRSMLTMRKAFGLPVGYSDHTMGIEVAVAAVALGAVVIEKHFTLDRNMDGPDHRASLEPHEFKHMVRAIRNVEQALGDGIKRPAQSEEDTRKVARKSLVAAHDIEIGSRITENDLSIKRPGTGIPPEYRHILINMTARKKIVQDAIIEWDDLKDA